MNCITNNAQFDKKTYTAGGGALFLILAFAFIYNSGGVLPALEKIGGSNNAIDGETPDDAKTKLQNEILDRTIPKLKSEGKDKDRILVTAGGGIGGGDGGCTMQATKIGDLNYFVRVKVTAQESTVDSESGQTVTYTYADMDEYEKITGTTVRIDNETGSVITDSNLTEEDYLNSRASIPDLNPEKLLIVSVQEPGTPGVNDFSNFYLTYDNNVFSAFC